MYRSNFEKRVIERVSERLNMNPFHVYIIYNSLLKGIVNVLKDPLTQKAYIPVLGKFQLSIQRCRTIEKRIVNQINKYSSIPDKIFKVNFDLLANVKFLIQKFGHK